MKPLTGGILLCGALTACGQTSHATVAGAPSSAPPAGCHTRIAVTESSTGQTVCVTRGGTVTVTLHSGSSGPSWSELAATAPLAPGTSTSPEPGVERSTWGARADGQATITAKRSNCPATPAPGTVSCLSVQGFTLTVKIV